MKYPFGGRGGGGGHEPDCGNLCPNPGKGLTESSECHNEICCCGIDSHKSHVPITYILGP